MPMTPEEKKQRQEQQSKHLLYELTNIILERARFTIKDLKENALFRFYLEHMDVLSEEKIEKYKHLSL